MKHIFEKILGKKHKKEPLFEIRRHTFDYFEGRGKRKSRKRREIYRLISKILSYSITGKRLRNIAIAVMGITLLGGVGVFFNLSVKEIDITRENSLVDINESYRSLNHLRGRNLLSIHKEQVLSRLQSSQAVIRDIRIKKIFPHTLRITVESYRPLYNSQIGLVMENGYLYTELKSRDPDIGMLDIVGYESLMIDSGPDLSTRDLHAIYILDRDIRENIPHLDIIAKKYYVRERELHIRDSFETLYIFELTENLQDQIEKLSIYFAERGEEAGNDMVYIDLRVPRGIFQCSSENERRCKLNLTNLYGEDALNFWSQLEQEGEDDT